LEICQRWGFSQPEAVRLWRVLRVLRVIFTAPDWLQIQLWFQKYLHSNW